jgi:hypothetical protein
MKAKAIVIIGILFSFLILLTAGEVWNPEDYFFPEGWLESVYKGELQKVKQVLESGQRVNTIDNQRMTALMWAVYRDQFIY